MVVPPVVVDEPPVPVVTPEPAVPIEPAEPLVGPEPPAPLEVVELVVGRAAVVASSPPHAHAAIKKKRRLDRARARGSERKGRRQSLNIVQQCHAP
jgi:hypothetical protein